MVAKQFTDADERVVRRYEYDDGWVVAADVGVLDEHVDVDVIGQTAIVVVDTGDSVSEAEFELPGSAENVDTNNGVLVITGEK